MKLTKKIFSIILCLVLAMSFIVAVPASAQVYSILEFSGLDLPVPGNYPDYTINSLSDDYDVMNFAGQDMIIWTDEDESYEIRDNEAFVEGHTYKVRIYLEPTNAQTELIPDAKFFMDNSGLGWYLYEDSNGLFAQKYFDVCGEIKNACLYIDKPSIGAKPDFTLVHDNRFVAEGNVSPVKKGVSWYNVTKDKYLISGTDDVFEEECAYLVTFNLRSYESEFVSGGKFTVNEYEGMVEILGNGFATVQFLFAPMEHKCAPEFVTPKAPTCTEEGYIGHYLCSCGKIYWDDEAKEEADSSELAIPSTGHSEITVAGKAATCTETGLTEGKKCEICDKVTVAQKEIPVIAHKEVVVAGKDATFFAEGLTEGKKCSVCNKVLVEQKAIAKLKLTKVKGLKATANKRGKATITWKMVSGATGYVIEYSTKKNFKGKTTKQIIIKKGTKTKAKLKKLLKGKKYFVRVKAFNITNGQEVFAKFSKKVSFKAK